MQQRVGRRHAAAEVLEARTLLAAPHPLQLGNGDVLGASGQDLAGASVTLLDDFNGDGLADLAIGAPSASVAALAQAGQVYVIYGRPDLFAGGSIDLRNLPGTDGFVLQGNEANLQLGSSLASADVNGDGLSDLIAAAPGATVQGQSMAGTVFVMFGRPDRLASDVSVGDLDGSDGFRLDGRDAGAGDGMTVAAAGDVNADGFEDIVVGQPHAGGTTAGQAYVVFGHGGSFDAVANLADLSGVNGFRVYGEPLSLAGSAVGSAGDFNGDGFDDVAIGAPFGGSDVGGAAYVLFGRGEGFASAYHLDTLSSGDGFRIDAEDTYDALGSAVGTAGDFNGDGFDDLVIGAYLANAHTATHGAAYVVFGTDQTPTSPFSVATLDGANGFRLDGEATNDHFGATVGAAGDINGDGLDELLIGAPHADGGDDSGAAYVLFGRQAAFPGPGFSVATLDGTNGFKIAGDGPPDRAGRSLAGRADVNGDGLDDLLIGAPYAPHQNGIDASAGAAYLLFGNDYGLLPAGTVGTPFDERVGGTASAEQLIGNAGADTLSGGGGADALSGGVGHDVLEVADGSFLRVDGGPGEDALVLTGGGVELDLRSVGRSAVQDVEVVDVRGSGANTLWLDDRRVVNLSSTSNRLTVLADADDVVHVGNRWDNVDARMEGGRSFYVLRSRRESAAELWVSVEAGIVFDLPESGGTYTLGVEPGTGWDVATLRDAGGEVLATWPHILGTGTFWVAGSSGDDRLIIDFTNGSPFGTGSVRFDGGGHVAGDALELRGSGPNAAFTRSVYTVTGPDSGEITLDSVRIEFSGLEPVRDETTVADRVFVAADGPTSLAVTDDAQIGFSRIEPRGGSVFEAYAFTTPERSLTVVTGDGDDALTVEALDPLFSGQVMLVTGGGNDLVDAAASSAPVRVDAGDGDDTALGSPFDDWVDGGAGADSLEGGRGDDTLNGGDGNDTLRGGDGDDLATGGGGADELYGEAGDDQLEGDAGDDRLDGGDGADRLHGGADDDALYGGVGADTLDGGDGADSAFGGDGADAVTGGAGDDSLLGEDGNDTIEGNDGADTILGGDDADRLFGNAGDDQMDGEQGDDLISGNSGNDSIQGGSDDDSLFGGAGRDTCAGGDGNDRVRGQGGDGDRVGGGNGDDTVDGGSGVDVLADSIEGTAQLADETLTTSGGTDRLMGIESAELSGGSGNDLIDASAATLPVTLSGGAGDDTLRGGTNADSLAGGDGRDVLEGGAGDDSLQGDAGDDLLIGGSGDDSVAGGDGNDSLNGGSGNDLIDASAATLPVTLSGGAGDDTLFGGAGNDALVGGHGADRVNGQGGADTVAGSDADTDVADPGDVLLDDAGEIDETFAIIESWADCL